MNILGKTGLLVNKIGCGGIPIQRVTQEEANRMIDEMIKRNINFIDSARGYTNSEKMFGVALKNKRSKFIIATKSMARDYEGMMKDIHTSIENFNTEYIDLYQLHNVAVNEDYSGALQALLDAKKTGLIKHIGVTTHSLDFLKTAIEKEEFETIQYPYNIVERQAEDLFQKAKRKNIGVIVMKPFAGGAINEYETALKFILNNENVSVIIPGMESVEQVINNEECLRKKLDERDNVLINKILKDLDEVFCRRCGYCLPCSKGINIPFVFLCEGYYTRYMLKEWALSRYKTLGINSNTCIKCGKCEKKCPYGLKIIDKLAKAIKVMEQNDEKV